jgi:hypothetical protein
MVVKFCIQQIDVRKVETFIRSSLSGLGCVSRETISVMMLPFVLGDVSEQETEHCFEQRRGKSFLLFRSPAINFNENVSAKLFYDLGC